MGERIVIIDDERSVHDVAPAYLERKSCDVVVELRSEPGRGTTARVVLPAESAVGDALAVAA